MGRDRHGRFTSGGGNGNGPDFMPELPLEAYMNTKHVTMAWGAAGTTEVVKTIDTNLDVEFLGDTDDRVDGGAFRGTKWVLYGADIQPAGKAELTAYNGISGGFALMAQILGGTQTALVDIDDDDVYATMQYQVFLETQGATETKFPLEFDLVSPTPVLDHKLTLILVSTDNFAPFQTTNEWILRLHYGVDRIRPADGNALWQKRRSS